MCQEAAELQVNQVNNYKKTREDMETLNDVRKTQPVCCNSIYQSRLKGEKKISLAANAVTVM